MGEHCINRCPLSVSKHRYINPDIGPEPGGRRLYWINPSYGSTKRYSRDGFTYYTIPALNQYLEPEDNNFFLFAYLYTDRGLYLIKTGEAFNIHSVRDGVFLPLRDVYVWDEEPRNEEPRNEEDERIKDYPIDLGHSSFFSIEEYSRQYNYGEITRSNPPNDITGIRENNDACSVKYAGELACLKTPNGDAIILYWNNGSGHFTPSSDSPCKSQLFFHHNRVRSNQGYFPQELFVPVDKGDEETKRHEIIDNLNQTLFGNASVGGAALKSKKSKSKTLKKKNKRRKKTKKKSKKKKKKKTKKRRR